MASHEDNYTEMLTEFSCEEKGDFPKCSMSPCEILIVIMARSICDQTLRKACSQLPLVEIQKIVT